MNLDLSRPAAAPPDLLEAAREALVAIELVKCLLQRGAITITDASAWGDGRLAERLDYPPLRAAIAKAEGRYEA